MLKKFTIYNLQFTIKLILFLFSFYFLLFTLPFPALAQTASPSSTSKESRPTFEVSQTALTPIPSIISSTSSLYTDMLVHNIFHTFSCLAVGQSIIGQPCLTYQITKNAQGHLQGVPVLSQVNLSGGAFGTTTNIIGLLYQNPPIRTADYLASVGQGLGIVKEAHAQVVGSGAGVLSPILTLWQVSRNISYIIMIIIFIVIGLMVMFRNRINPQTVITAQAALPGLVIGLILITFSFFLAGLISDMAFVGTNVVGYYFAAAQEKTNDPERTNLVDTISSKNVLSIFGPLVGIVSQDQANKFINAIMSPLGGDVQASVRLFATFLGVQFMSPIAGGIPPPWGLVAGPLLNIGAGLSLAAAPEFFMGFFLGFVATFALMYAMIKLLIRLVSSYLTIIFLTISAPFQFLASALPGRQDIATGWILNILANILVFPAVIAVLYFVAFILGPSVVGVDYPLKVTYSNQIENNITPVAYAQQPLKIVDRKTFPLLGGLDLNFVQILLAFGALMALPSIPEVVVRAIGRMGQAGQLIGQEISGGVKSGQGYVGQQQSNIGQGFSNIKRGIFGQSGYHWEPGKGMVWGPVQPGMFTGVGKDPVTGKWGRKL